MEKKQRLSHKIRVWQKKKKKECYNLLILKMRTLDTCTGFKAEASAKPG